MIAIKKERNVFKPQEARRFLAAAEEASFNTPEL